MRTWTVAFDIPELGPRFQMIFVPESNLDYKIKQNLEGEEQGSSCQPCQSIL